MRRAPDLLGHSLYNGQNNFHIGDLPGIKSQRMLHRIQKYKLSLVKIVAKKAIIKKMLKNKFSVFFWRIHLEKPQKYH
jgi:hypothetical protein